MHNQDIYTRNQLASDNIPQNHFAHLFSYQVPPTPAFFS